MPAINYFAVVLAMASSMAVGAIWYSRRVFGQRWATMAKVDLGAASSQSRAPLILAAMLGFVTS